MAITSASVSMSGSGWRRHRLGAGRGRRCAGIVGLDGEALAAPAEAAGDGLGLRRTGISPRQATQADDVGEQREPCARRDHHEAHLHGQRQDDRDEGPTTHVSWKRVSKRANDRPRLASGVRCTTESKASLPLLAATPTHRPRRGRHDAARPRRQHGPARGEAEDDLQDALLARARPAQRRGEQRARAASRRRWPPHHAELGGCASSVRRASAMRNVRKPTMPASGPSPRGRMMPPPAAPRARSRTCHRPPPGWPAPAPAPPPP